MRPEAVKTAVSVGFETLRANPLRTILSTLGVIIGVGSLVAVLSVGDGIERSLREQIAATTDLHAVSVRARTVEEIDGQLFPIADPLRLTPGHARAVGRIEGVSRVTYTRQGQAEVRSPFGPARRMAVLTAELVMPDTTGPRALLAGRRLTSDEVAGSGTLAVVSRDLALSMADDSVPASAVGAMVLVGGVPAEVVGVLDSAAAPPIPVARRPGDYRMWSTAGLVDRVLPDPVRAPATIVAHSATVERTNDVKARIEQSFSASDTAGGRGIVVSTNERRIEQLSTSILIFKLFLGAITGISLLVGGIGIMNVLLSSVTERTREIGIRKATGAQDRDIRWQFLAESVVISGVGSAIGLVIGVSGAFGITAGIRRFAAAPFLSASLSASTVLVAVLAAVIVGLVFGTYPARRAAQLSPIDAIRHE